LSDERLHSYCNDISPAEFEAAFYAAQEADQSLVGIQARASINPGWFNARYLSSVGDSSVRGLVACALTSPPCGVSLHGQVRTRPGRGIRRPTTGYSTDPANLAHLGTPGLLDGLHHVLLSTARLLRPGRFVALTVRPFWGGELVDLPGAVEKVAAIVDGLA